MVFVKAIILIAGQQKGTRFRPLSLGTPKPLFPVAGIPIVQHHIEALALIESVKEVLLLGFFPASEMSTFVEDMNRLYKNLNVRYLQEFAPLGTAGAPAAFPFGRGAGLATTATAPPFAFGIVVLQQSAPHSAL